MEHRRHRILNKNGSVTVGFVDRRSKARLKDMGHILLTTTWPRFFAFALLCYTSVNLVFATLYMTCGACIQNAEPGSFLDHFFFSVQTLATIGYGQMVPTGLQANLLVALEALMGMMFMALSASLAYARFTRPSAGVVFSEKAVIGTFDGKPALMLRFANQRQDEIIEAQASLNLVRDETLQDGRSYRRIHDLALVRSTSPVFALSWTVVHIIDETSPLYGQSTDDLRKNMTEFLVLFTGHHVGFYQRVHARQAYAWWEIEWNSHFADMIRIDPEGKRLMDMSQFNRIEAMEIEVEPSGLIKG